MGKTPKRKGGEERGEKKGRQFVKKFLLLLSPSLTKMWDEKSSFVVKSPQEEEEKKLLV